MAVNKFLLDFVQQRLATPSQVKTAFVPSQQAFNAQDAQGQAGGAPPMDPSQAGGMPPMDPSQAGAMPPMPADPSQAAGGGDPSFLIPPAPGGQDPSMAGGTSPFPAPPPDPSAAAPSATPTGGGDSSALAKEIAEQLHAMQGGSSKPKEGGKHQIAALTDKVALLEKLVRSMYTTLGLSVPIDTILDNGGQDQNAPVPMPKSDTPPIQPKSAQVQAQINSQEVLDKVDALKWLIAARQYRDAE